ncbi:MULTISPECIES: hypothetical protein [unclassified Microcoleus]
MSDVKLERELFACPAFDVGTGIFCQQLRQNQWIDPPWMCRRSLSEQ